LALDLFTVDLLDGTKAYVLAAIEHATRRIRILGATAHPGGQWIVQQARNLCMDLDQAGGNVKFVLHDRDATFHEGFDAVFTAAGLRIVRSGVRMPRMNSNMERWIGGCRRELLDRTLIWTCPTSAGSWRPASVTTTTTGLIWPCPAPLRSNRFQPR
jgi:putative transposase